MKKGLLFKRLRYIAFFVNWVLICGCDPCELNGPTEEKDYDIYYDAMPLGSSSPNIYGVNYGGNGPGAIVDNGMLFSLPNSDDMMAFFRMSETGIDTLMYKKLGVGGVKMSLNEVPYPGLGFVMCNPKRNYILFASGSRLNYLTITGTGGIEISSVFNRNTLPSFAPDGAHIAYYTGDSTGAAMKLVVVSTDNIKDSVAVSLPNGVNTGAGKISIAWSADSKSFVFAAYENGSSNDIIIRSIDGNSETIVDDDSLVAMMPIVSPGMDSVCFAASDGNIWLKNIRNGKLWKITNCSQSDYYSYPRWSPDGGKIMFIRYPRNTGEFSGTLEVYSMKSSRRSVLGNNVSRAFWSVN